MRRWINLLPVFIARRLAYRYGERFLIGGATFYQATRGVLFLAPESDKQESA